MDFSQNVAIKCFDKAQSKHWQKLNYSLFMSIWSFLSVDEQNKVDGKFSKYDEVNVDGEFYIIGQPKPSIYKEYFW